jgi:hypothetical protein
MRVPVLTLAALVALASCTEQASTQESQVVARVLANTAVVHDDRLEFPKSSINADLRERITSYEEAIASGKSNDDVENVILVADRAEDAVDESGRVAEDAGNKYGFIRRALSVRDEGDKTIIMTEPATLEEAFEELEENGVTEISPPQGSEPGSDTQGKKTFQKTIPVIDLTGKELYRNGNNVIRLGSSFISVDAKVDTGVEIGLASLKQAHAIVDATIKSELVVEGTIDDTFAADFSARVYAASWPIGFVGPVPVTLDLQTFLTCSLESGGDFSGSVGVGADLKVRAGLTYTKQAGLDGTFDSPVFTPRMIGPELEASGTAAVVCGLEPKLALLFFDVAGPQVSPNFQADVQIAIAQPPTVTVIGGLDVSLGGTLQAFGRKQKQYEKQILDTQTVLYEGSF